MPCSHSGGDLRAHAALDLLRPPGFRDDALGAYLIEEHDAEPLVWTFYPDDAERILILCLRTKEDTDYDEIPSWLTESGSHFVPVRDSYGIAEAREAIRRDAEETKGIRAIREVFKVLGNNLKVMLGC